MSKPKSSTAPDAANNSVPRTPYAFLAFTTRPYRNWMIGAIVIVIIASAASQGTNYFLKLIVDAVESGNQENVIYYALAYPVSVLLVQTLFRFSAFFGRRWVLQAMKRGYDQLSMYVLQHGHAYFSDRFSGSIMSKMNNIVAAIEQAVIDFLWTHLTALVSFVVTFGFILSVDLLAASIFLALIVVLFVVNLSLAKKKAELSRFASEAKTALRGSIVDALSNVQAVRQYSMRPHEEAKIGVLSETARKAQHTNWDTPNTCSTSTD